jgi:hypothetical protein
MSRFDLLDNFIDNPEALIRRTRAKLKNVHTEASSSTSQLEAPPSKLGAHPSIFQSLTPEFDAMANKSLREFSAPTTDNIHTGPAVDIEKTFELKPALINMVQASQFCGKAHEDASAHLQHLLEICSTFTIKDVPRDAILVHLFPFSLLGRAKQ